MIILYIYIFIGLCSASLGFFSSNEKIVRSFRKQDPYKNASENVIFFIFIVVNAFLWPVILYRMFK